MMHLVRKLLRGLRILLITDVSAILLAVFTGVASLLAAPFDRTGNFHQAVAACCSRLFLKISGVKVIVEGWKRVPKGRSYVFVSNHLSMLDIPVVLAHLQLPFRFLAKKSLFHMPFVGWNLRFGRHVAVFREHKLLAARALHQAEQLLRQGISVFVFAEGTRSTQGLRRFKPGAAHLALRTQAPVVPVALIGADHCLPLGSIHVRPGTVALRIGQAIDPPSWNERHLQPFTEYLHRQVAQLLHQPSPNVNHPEVAV